MANAIEVNALTKSYGKSRGVIDLDFTVKEGEVFGYLGPNGAGKTTTIRLLLDFIRPTKGGAKIFDLDTNQYSFQVREYIGYLPGELHLYEKLTGRQHLNFLKNLRGGIDPKKIKGLAERFQADLNVPIRSLSHGNRQKIGIIQAFMHEPALLILDEPTTGLDPLMQIEFSKLVLEAKKGGATVFISSHILPEVEKISDRVGIIREGRLITLETVEKLRAKAARQIEVIFSKPADKTLFSKIDGVQDIEIVNNHLICRVIGSVDKLLKTVSKQEVLNIITHEPDLEEVFLTYYKEKADV